MRAVMLPDLTLNPLNIYAIFLQKEILCHSCVLIKSTYIYWYQLGASSIESVWIVYSDGLEL